MPEPSILFHPGALIRCPHFWPFAAEATGQAGLPAASPPRMSVAPPNELLGNFPSLWGRPPASARPPGGARPSRWLTGAGRRRTHLVCRWSYGGGGGGGGVAVLRARFKAQPSDGGGHTRDEDRPHLVLAAAGLLRREGGSQRPRPPGARGRAGEPSAASTTPDDGLAATLASRGPRATGCHLTFWVWLHSVLSPRSLAPLFRVLRPERRAQASRAPTALDLGATRASGELRRPKDLPEM